MSSTTRLPSLLLRSQTQRVLRSRSTARLSTHSNNFGRASYCLRQSSSSSSSDDGRKAKAEADATKSGNLNSASSTNNAHKANAPTHKQPFIAVINVPEGEFAHNAFFSLHRPLLGLANEERAFFDTDTDEVEYPDNKSTEDYESLAQYFSSLRPFEGPAHNNDPWNPLASMDSFEPTSEYGVAPGDTQGVLSWLEAMRTRSLGKMQSTDIVEKIKFHQSTTQTLTIHFPKSENTITVQTIVPPETAGTEPSLPAMRLTSVLRKRRLKMNKHKHKKLMKKTRALRKRVGN
ncbi:hypothetical protein BZG36_03800 [Bifiguratus adelaidae]|uniref:Small ribosomal subunit protein mS38 n=1 Tax=Bifiguratus adelaidae TaxID=1938954 RepID=A0A261XX27_9FUNG|nr:hypothetical protein BZG36_03800 [Bifiguratus adelaidae]